MLQFLGSVRCKGKPCFFNGNTAMMRFHVLCDFETGLDAKTEGHFKIILAEPGDVEILR